MQTSQLLLLSLLLLSFVFYFIYIYTFNLQKGKSKVGEQIVDCAFMPWILILSHLPLTFSGPRRASIANVLVLYIFTRSVFSKESRRCKGKVSTVLLGLMETSTLPPASHLSSTRTASIAKMERVIRRCEGKSMGSCVLICRCRVGRDSLMEGSAGNALPEIRPACEEPAWGFVDGRWYCRKL